jgi:hypothetical protein
LQSALSEIRITTQSTPALRSASEGVGCFRSSEGFSQVISHSDDFPALFCSYAAASLTAQAL